ncbi:MAG: hypothetical protein U5K77_03640 [Candidatus Saccharibacteria bacterium]|nr:hypothetical protein [Candidatus Saccharibacteria bacterium]
MTEIPTGSLLPGFSSVDIIDYSARRQFGLPVSENLHRTWHSVMSVVTYLDAIEDGDYGQQGELNVEDIVGFISGEAEEAPQLPNIHASIALEGLVKNFKLVGLEDSHRQEFVDNSISLALLHAGNPVDSSVKSLTRHRLAQGRLFGKLFSDVVPDVCRTDRFEEFEEWVQVVGAVSEVVDSIWDLSEDHRTGKTAVQPILKNRALLAWHATPESMVAAKNMSPMLAGKLAVKAVLFGVNRSGRFNAHRTK